MAKGHVKAVEYALEHKGAEVFNLGTGTPYSVTEIVDSFEKSTGVEIKHVYGDRRSGDLPESYANADKAWKVTANFLPPRIFNSKLLQYPKAKVI